MAAHHTSLTVAQSNLEHLTGAQKVILFDSCQGHRVLITCQVTYLIFDNILTKDNTYLMDVKVNFQSLPFSFLLALSLLQFYSKQ